MLLIFNLFLYMLALNLMTFDVPLSWICVILTSCPNEWLFLSFSLCVVGCVFVIFECSRCSRVTAESHHTLPYPTQLVSSATTTPPDRSLCTSQPKHQAMFHASLVFSCYYLFFHLPNLVSSFLKVLSALSLSHYPQPLISSHQPHIPSLEGS